MKIHIVSSRIRLKGDYKCIDCNNPQQGVIRLLELDSHIFQMGSLLYDLGQHGEMKFHVSYNNVPRFEQMLDSMKISGVKFSVKKKEKVESRNNANMEKVLVNEYVLKRTKK